MSTQSDRSSAPNRLTDGQDDLQFENPSGILVRIVVAEVGIELLEPKHADAMQRMASDERISATSDVLHPYPEGEAARFIATTRDSPCLRQFAILVDGEFGGVVGLHHIDSKGAMAQLDYWVAVPLWGRGIATAAAGLAMRYARDELSLRKLRSRCLEDNSASRRVLEKLGFEVRGSFVADPKGKSRFRAARILRLSKTLTAE